MTRATHGRRATEILYINPHLGHYAVAKLLPQHVAMFYREMSKRLVPASVRRIHAVPWRALTVAVRWDSPRAIRHSWSTHRPLSTTEIRPYSIAEAGN